MTVRPAATPARAQRGPRAPEASPADASPPATTVDAAPANAAIPGSWRDKLVFVPRKVGNNNAVIVAAPEDWKLDNVLHELTPDGSAWGYAQFHAGVERFGTPDEHLVPAREGQRVLLDETKAGRRTMVVREAHEVRVRVVEMGDEDRGFCYCGADLDSDAAALATAFTRACETVVRAP